MKIGIISPSSLTLGLIGMAGALLTACNKAEGDAPGSTLFDNGERKAEDQFGQKFAKAYRAPANSEPADVRDGDAGAVSLRDEPVPIE